MVLLDYIPDPQLDLFLVMLSVSFIVNVSAPQRVSEDKMASTARKLALGSLSSGRGGANRTVWVLDKGSSRKNLDSPQGTHKAIK